MFKFACYFQANDTDAVENEDGKTSEKLGRRVETSMNPEESIGPFGKVIFFDLLLK